VIYGETQQITTGDLLRSERLFFQSGFSVLIVSGNLSLNLSLTFWGERGGGFPLLVHFVVVFGKFTEDAEEKRVRKGSGTRVIVVN